ncbi:MAG: nucleotidyltransferase family protein [Wenzhouxiangellaceae bacterium]|nr:nucleotidyltransferase family protein [Wenzhouxiangellaceae bacterium]
MSFSASLRIVVLAGDRKPGDSLALAHGVAGKVLVPVQGRPLLSHVMQAIGELADVDEVVLVGPDHEAYARAAGDFCSYRRIDPAAGPAASLARALAGFDDDGPVMAVTADHPLIQPEWLEQFRRRADATGADAVVGLVDWKQVHRAFPDNRRTCYRFADFSVCGTNLFYFRTPHGRTVATVWKQFEADRKKPWKIVSRLGWLNLLRYLTGRLKLDHAVVALSRHLGISLASVFIDHPEAAVDVDSSEDLELVCRIFAQRTDPA